MNLMRYRPQHLDFNWDRIVDRFFQDRFFEGGGSIVPAVDVRESDQAYLVEMELPGLSEKDVNVDVENETLTISSKKNEEKEEKQDGYLRKERVQHRFSRSFRLPENVNAAKIDANLKNGLLTVSIPKAPEARPRSIEVKVAN